MAELKLLVRADYPSSVREVDILATTKLSEVKVAVARALGWEVEVVGKYHMLCVEWLHDAIDLAKLNQNSSLAQAGVVDRSTLLLQAPADIKPPLPRKKKGAADVSADDEKGANRYKGFTPKNAISKLLSLKGKKKKIAWEYVDIYAQKIIPTQTFQKLPLKLVIDIVKRDTLSIKEVDLFDSCYKWAQREAKEQKMEETPDTYKTLLADILPHIRFPVMTTQDVALKVSPAKLLDSQQTLHLFTYLGTKGSKLHACLKYNNKPRKARKPPAWFKFDAAMKHTNMTVDADGFVLSSNSTSYYSPIFGNVELKDGQHEWEIELTTIYAHSYAIHIGVSPVSFTEYTRSGMIGYSGHIPGYSFSVYGALKYINGTATSYGKMCTNGDRVRVFLDLDKRTLAFAVNDAEPVVAFDNVEGPVRPSISLYGNNTCKLVFPQ